MLTQLAAPGVVCYTSLASLDVGIHNMDNTGNTTYLLQSRQSSARRNKDCHNTYHEDNNLENSYKHRQKDT